MEGRRCLDADEAPGIGGCAAAGEEVEGDPQGRCLDLTSFQLHDLREVEIPDDLVELDLTANRLSELDPRIRLLPQLRKLSLRQNLFDDKGVEPISQWKAIAGLLVMLPMEGLSTLENLRVLDISSNKLTMISDIDKLTRLEDLWLNDNHIASLEGIDLAVSGSRERLTTIYLERNPCVRFLKFQGVII
ncbi:hypothetical protein GW17_00050235 [Ensete ventricosum]|nr:hypothetical protein GW17_00050235 [Ensete ventricosum]